MTFSDRKPRNNDYALIIMNYCPFHRRKSIQQSTMDAVPSIFHIFGHFYSHFLIVSSANSLEDNEEWCIIDIIFSLQPTVYNRAIYKSERNKWGHRKT